MIDFLVIEAITYKAGVERHEAEKEAQREAELHSKTRGQGLKDFARGG